MNRLDFKPLSFVLERSTQEGIKIAVFGDVHFDHMKVYSWFITDRLDQILTDEYLQMLDVLVINGDLFERRMAFDSESAHRVFRWMTRLLQRCAYFDVSLNILEGTPSHDHKQAQWFENIVEMLGLNIDFSYHKQLQIKEIRKGTGITALWVPDELNHDAKTTQQQVTTLMATEGVSKVDFAFMHGMFGS